MTYTNQITQTLKSIKKQPYNFLFSILSDFALFVLSFGIFYYLYLRLFPHLEEMSKLMAGGLYIDLDPAFYTHYHAALGIITMLVISLFIAFVLIKSSNYKFFVLNKKGYWKYLLKFAGVNAIWGAAFFILLSLYLRFVFSTVTSLNPIISMKTAGIIYYIANAALIYFAALSYILIDKGFLDGFKKSFVIGAKKANVLVWNFLIIFAVVYALRFFIADYPFGSAVFMFLVILPMMGFNRVFVKEIVKKKKSKKKD